METVDYRLHSYIENGEHFVRGYLIGTKPTNLGPFSWSLSKKTINDKVKQFKDLETDFIAVPDLLKKSAREGHIFASTYEELLEKQKPAVRGKIKEIYGPYDYEDGTDDVYYKFKAKVEDPDVSKALAAGVLPLSVSPYVWPRENGKLVDPELLTDRHEIEDWIPAHVALVKEGAFGWRAVLDKQCFGSEGQCNTALAASSIDTANSISSQLQSEAQKTSEMSENTQANLANSPAGNTNSLPTVDNAPIKNNAPNISSPTGSVSVEEFNALKEQLKDYDTVKKTNEKLVLKLKTEALNKIFGSVNDEETKKALYKRYMNVEDFDVLSDLHNDIMSHVVPLLKAKAPEENKPDSRKQALAASKDEEHDCGCSKNKDKTDFPLAGSSTGSAGSRLNRERSLTEMFGVIKV